MTALRSPSYGNAPVPFAAMWTGEDQFFLAQCPHFKALALCQRSAIGEGKPQFATPHMDRQRQVIALDRCDLCLKPLRHRTRVSLSDAKAYSHGADGWAVLQVEPMVHKDCARRCLALCPALGRRVADGSMIVRQVFKSRVQCAILSPEYIGQYAGRAVKALGHAKVELIDWTEREIGWLA